MEENKTSCCGCSCDDIKKIIGIGLVVAIVGTIISSVTCGWLFNDIYTIDPFVVWKYTKEVPNKVMLVSFIGNIILSIILVWVFTILRSAIPHTGWKKGVKFGFLVWLVGILPGMFATYVWMNVAIEWIIYATILGLVTLMIKGAIISVMSKS